MKLEITRKGAHDTKGNPLEVGKVVDVKGNEVPAYLVNKAIEVKVRKEKAADSDKEPVTNPAPAAPPAPNK